MEQSGTTRAEWRGEGGGGRDEDGTGAGISSIIIAEFAEIRREGKKCSGRSIHRRFRVQTNPQGWLPPAISTQASLLTSHPKPAE